VRKLSVEIPAVLKENKLITGCNLIMPGVIAIQMDKFKDQAAAQEEIYRLNDALKDKLMDLSGIPMLVLCDDAAFIAANLRNFLWVTFTRSNPSHDIYGIADFQLHKHWGCSGPFIIDARIKPHHAPPVELDPQMVKKTDRFFIKGGLLSKYS
jgi:4-hydroxy-3-polyprenylbenzoate decarboxylase